MVIDGRGKRYGVRVGRTTSRIPKYSVTWFLLSHINVLFHSQYTPPLQPPRGEVNAADAFDIGSFDEEDTRGIKVRLKYQITFHPIIESKNTDLKSTRSNRHQLLLKQTSFYHQKRP